MALNETTPLTSKRDDLLPTALDTARIEAEEALQRNIQEDARRVSDPLRNDDISSIANGYTAQNLRFSALYATRDNGHTVDDATGEAKKSNPDIDMAINQLLARNNEMIANINRRLSVIQREIQDCDQRLEEIAELKAAHSDEIAALEVEKDAALEKQGELAQAGVEAAQATVKAETEDARYNGGEKTRAWNRHGDKVAEQYVKAGVGEEFALLDRHRRGETVDPQKLQEAREKIEETGLTSNMGTAMRTWLRENIDRAQRAQNRAQDRIDENKDNLERIRTRLAEIGDEMKALKGEEQATIENRQRLTTEQTTLTKELENRTRFQNDFQSPDAYLQKVRETRQALGGNWRDAMTCVDNDYFGTCAAPASFLTRTSAADAGISTAVPVQSAFATAASGVTAPIPATPAPLTPERQPLAAAPAPGQ